MNPVKKKLESSHSKNFLFGTYGKIKLKRWIQKNIMANLEKFLKSLIEFLVLASTHGP